MPFDASNEFRETVRSATDIVSIIGESVALISKNNGREYVCLCPFHDDHNPSMHVYPDRQSYRCWVCDEGGDVFSFVMKQENVGFREALELLAHRANVPIPQGRAGSSQQGGASKSSLYDVLTWAEELFHHELMQSGPAAAAREYLHGRGFDEAVIRKYRLGYVPNSWDFLLTRCRGKFTPQQLNAARLAKQRESGEGYFDFFRGRVMFPIRNERGQCVSFGGRILPGSGDESGPKYINGVESPVFAKSKLVYGLDTARDAIRDTGSVVVVEGYTDCISLQVAGIMHTVGTLGTALTDAHVMNLKRFAPRVVLVYDGDTAGQMAAERAVGRFLAQDVDLRILTLPESIDPAEYVAERGQTALIEQIASASEAWDYKFERRVEDIGLDTIDGRQRVVDDMLALLATVPKMSASIREGLLLSRLSQRTRLPETVVRERYAEVRREATRRQSYRSENNLRVDPAQAGNEHDVPRDVHRAAVDHILSASSHKQIQAQCELLQCIFDCPQLASIVLNEVSNEEMHSDPLRVLFDHCRTLDDTRQSTTFANLLGRLEDNDLKRLVVWLDEQAHRKNIGVVLHQELTAMQNDPQLMQMSDGCPQFLRRSIDNVKWHHAEQSQQRMAMKIVERGDGAQRLDGEAAELLRKATEFHQQRVTRKAAMES